MVNEHNLDYHSGLSRFTQRFFSYFYILQMALSFSKIYVEFFLKPIFHHSWGKFSNLCSDYGFVNQIDSTHFYS